MRILILGIALLALTCSAFAQLPITEKLDDTVGVTMNIGTWVNIDIPAANVGFSGTTNDPNRTGTVAADSTVVNITTNCPWKVSGTQADLTDAVLGRHIDAAGLTLGGVAPTSGFWTGSATGNGGLAPALVASYTRTALDDYAGTYKGDVKLTIAPAL